jgi:hypothetical protein
VNEEATFEFREFGVRNGKRAMVFVAAIALLGMAEFSYAQLRQVGDWPLALIASSVGRLISARLEIFSGMFWLAPLGLIATGLLASAASAWRARRAAADEERVNNHE